MIHFIACRCGHGNKVEAIDKKAQYYQSDKVHSLEFNGIQSYCLPCNNNTAFSKALKNDQAPAALLLLFSSFPNSSSVILKR